MSTGSGTEAYDEVPQQEEKAGRSKVMVYGVFTAALTSPLWLPMAAWAQVRGP